MDYETGAEDNVMYKGDRILRKKSLEYLQDTTEILHDEPYAKAYLKPMFQIAKTLKGTELQMVYFLLPFLSYESGMLKHPNGQPLNRTYIAKETGLSINSVDRILQKLKEKRIISRNVTGHEVQYLMNPWLFMRGKRINKTLYDIFKNSEWAKVYNIQDKQAKKK